jgi:hypothetical protein
MSSPVSLRGPGNQSAKPSSMTSPVAGSRTRTSAARRGSGTRPVIFSSATRARGPDMRTTAIAAGGRPEESAKTVSRSEVMPAHKQEPPATVKPILRGMGAATNRRPVP